MIKKIILPGLILALLLTILPAMAYAETNTLLKIGSSGDEVKVLQTLLNENSAELAVDGQFGSITETVVIKYQENKRLTVDGIVGSQTWASLRESYTTLRIGSSGEAVKTLQTLLNGHGAALTADGQFGSITEAAVVKYQQSRALTADGIVGPQTWSSLLSVASSSSVVTNNQRQQIVDLAYKALGVRYVYASSSLTNGFDCSGLTYWAYNQIGISVPRSSSGYYTAGQGIRYNDIKPGDILAMDTNSNDAINHVGIYVGNGQMIHASSRLGKVVLQDVDQYLSWGVKLITVRQFLSN